MSDLHWRSRYLSIGNKCVNTLPLIYCLITRVAATSGRYLPDWRTSCISADMRKQRRWSLSRLPSTVLPAMIWDQVKNGGFCCCNMMVPRAGSLCPLLLRTGVPFDVRGERANLQVLTSGGRQRSATSAMMLRWSR